jgi:group II intron reverse transcriptase/maturase
MRNAEAILDTIRKRGTRGLPLERVYRLLYNQELYLVAYEKIRRNKGAMTQGTTTETVDWMSEAKINAIIEMLRQETYRFQPVRRTHIPKPNGRTRPLGIPTWSYKLVQEVIRMILEAYYEPQFSDHSHGFRPKRGCHTALQEIRHQWPGTKWFIEGDIKGCFDNVDHDIVMHILSECIHDGRFLGLIRQMLDAGYMEQWNWHPSLSGTPQGGVVSPILANVYLDRLDKYVEDTLMPLYNRGEERALNPAYIHERSVMMYARKTRNRVRAKEHRKRMLTLPYRDPNDPDYRRLRYVRYADDFLLGFAGPKEEAEAIKTDLRTFLRNTLKLELSEEKTLITHAKDGSARFLGYDISVYDANTKRAAKLVDRRRSINGRLAFRIPKEVMDTKLRRYMRDGKAHHRSELEGNDAYSIISEYHMEFKGLMEYYRMALNLHSLGYLMWVMESSLLKTLSMKYKISVSQVMNRFGYHDGQRWLLRAVVERKGKKPLVATWGDYSLRHEAKAILKDRPAKAHNGHTELIQRMKAEVCEQCGSTEDINVHHIRSIWKLHTRNGKEMPEWKKWMIAHQRKTMVLCRPCHAKIHGSTWVKPMHAPRAKRTAVTGEPDDAKVSSPVRRGANEKVPFTIQEEASGR